MNLNVILGIFSSYKLYILLLIVLAIIIAVKSGKEEAEVAVNATQVNKVVNVTLKGGLIGLLCSSPMQSLNRKIQKENSAGWKVVQVIPADSGNVFLIIFRLFLLILTLFLFTTSNGYYVIVERTTEVKSVSN